MRCLRCCRSAVVMAGVSGKRGRHTRGMLFARRLQEGRLADNVLQDKDLGHSQVVVCKMGSGWGEPPNPCPPKTLVGCGAFAGTAEASKRSAVSAGIKRPQFRRFCSAKKTAIGQDAVPTLYEILNSPWLKPDGRAKIGVAPTGRSVADGMTAARRAPHAGRDT